MFGSRTVTSELARLRGEIQLIQSRNAALEAQATERAMRIADLRDDLKRATGEVSRLTDLVASMQREGVRPAVTVTEVEVPRRELPDEVMAEINRLAKPRSDLHRRLQDHAWELVDGNADAADIVRRIRYGRLGPPDDGEGE
jgi:predicted  nucleic acid-binding Zn-ribbon protein